MRYRPSFHICMEKEIKQGPDLRYLRQTNWKGEGSFVFKDIGSGHRSQQWIRPIGRGSFFGVQNWTLIQDCEHPIEFWEKIMSIQSKLLPEDWDHSQFKLMMEDWDSIQLNLLTEDWDRIKINSMTEDWDHLKFTQWRNDEIVSNLIRWRKIEIDPGEIYAS